MVDWRFHGSIGREPRSAPDIGGTFGGCSTKPGTAAAAVVGFITCYAAAVRIALQQTTAFEV